VYELGPEHGLVLGLVPELVPGRELALALELELVLASVALSSVHHLPLAKQYG
jgi:hypothetical protein